jgi:hypothetical protein
VLDTRRVVRSLFYHIRRASPLVKPRRQLSPGPKSRRDRNRTAVKTSRSWRIQVRCGAAVTRIAVRRIVEPKRWVYRITGFTPGNGRVVDPARRLRPGPHAIQSQTGGIRLDERYTQPKESHADKQSGARCLSECLMAREAAVRLDGSWSRQNAKDAFD